MYYTNHALVLAILYEKINTKESLNNKKNLLDNLVKIQPRENMIKTFRHHYYSYNDAYASYYHNPWTLDFVESRKYHFDNLKLAQKSNDTYLFTNVYTNLGWLYSSVKNDSAVYYLNAGFESTSAFTSKARNRNLLAMHYLKNKNPKMALETVDIALNYSLSSNEKEKLPSAKILLEKTIDRDVTLWTLVNKANALMQLYESDKQLVSHITKALKLLKTADAFIDEINTKDFETNSKFYWRKEASDIYSKIVLCSKILNNPQETIYATEKGRALLLTETILNNQSKNDIPEHISLRENYLKSEINALSYQLEIQENDILQKTLFQSKNNYDVFIDSVRTEYPWFKTVNKSSEIYDIKGIQEALFEDQVVLWYSLSANTDYINKASTVLLSKNDIKIEVIENQERLMELVGQYSTLVSKPLETNNDIKSFKEIAHDLYTMLIPENFRNTLKDKHAIIITEGNLQNIPFGSLISLENSDNYLIYDTKISYAYSMSSLLHGQQLNRGAKNTLIGFAPISFESEDLPELSYSNNEINNIKKSISGDFYTHNEARSSTFLNKSSDYKIIHLATHADASSNPWIGFSNKKLSLHELYTYSNNADLVTLSACNTSKGEQAKGEGILSLARGFFHSGANSVIASLWNINDKQTSQIVTTFYENLKAGQSKVNALHNAKITYLKNNTLAEASPYYWSSLVLIGDTESITFGNTLSLKNILLFIAISVLAFIVGRIIYKKVR